MTAAPSVASTRPGLIPPHGGALVNLMLGAEELDAAKSGVNRRVECSDRNACDVVLLVVGGFYEMG